MSTIETNNPNFESIDAHIHQFELNVFTPPTPDQEPLDREELQALTFALVRPILAALATTPLIPSDWQAALRMFLSANDMTTEAFKAGKDLAIAPIDPSLIN